MNYKESGTALITALLIMTLVTVIATATLLSARLLIHQTDLNTSADQMLEALQGANDWAEMTLLTPSDLRKIKPLKTTLNNIAITATIDPQQSLLDINSLAFTENIPHFVLLLQHVIPSLSTEKATQLAQAIHDWIAQDANHNDVYLNANPPYVPPHERLTTLSELRLVAGVTQKIYQALHPYLTALPSAQYGIDLNYATPILFSTISNKITLSQAENWYHCAKMHGLFLSTTDFIKICAPGQENNLMGLTVNEDFYLVHATANKGVQQLILTSLMMRYKTKENKTKIQTIWQQMNIES